MLSLVQENLPLITAVIPVYNHEQYVIESIRSVIAQSYPNIELIVINDGSKDRSHEMVLSLVDECKQRFTRFEYISRENRGLSATLNQALEMAQGKYLGLLASDDIILPDKFSCLVGALEPTDDHCAGAFGNASFIDKHGRTTYSDARGNPHDSMGDKTYSNFLDLHAVAVRRLDYRTQFGTYRSLIGGNYLPAMSALLKTRTVKKVGGWTAGNVLDDWEMWLKLTKHHNLLFVDKTVARYRIHGKNTILIMRQELEQATLTLLLREKEYCARNGMGRLWQDSFYRFFYWGMIYGDAPITNRLRQLHYLQPSDVFSSISFLTRTAFRKIMEKWSTR
jgi:alpha-1,3-rhamnosyltransferase